MFISMQKIIFIPPFFLKYLKDDKNLFVILGTLGMPG